MRLISENDLALGGLPIGYLNIGGEARAHTDYRLTNLAQNNVTASRNITGTIYQNTSGKVKLVSITVRFQVYKASTSMSGAASVVFYCDASSSPTTQIGNISQTISLDGLATSGNIYQDIPTLFWVLPNYYYKAVRSATGDAIDPALQYWVESDLF